MTPATTAAARVHSPRPASVPARRPQRRYSGPQRVARPRTQPAPQRARAGLLATAGRVCDLPLLDRLIRGRFWIGLVAVALLGIVAMELSLLKLEAGIGRAMTHTALLQRQNADLEAQVSTLSDTHRIEAAAAKLGMVPVPPSALRFLSVLPGQGHLALAAVREAQPAATAATLAAGGSVLGVNPPASTATTGAGVDSSTPSSSSYATSSSAAAAPSATGASSAAAVPAQSPIPPGG